MYRWDWSISLRIIHGTRKKESRIIYQGNIYLIVKRFLNFERIEQILNEVKERSLIEICHRIKKSSDAQYVAVRSTDW